MRSHAPGSMARREGGGEEAPTPMDSTAHLAGGSQRRSACSKATAKGRTQGWLQQLAPSKRQLPCLLASDRYACHGDPHLFSQRSRSTEPCPPWGWQSCRARCCWQRGRDPQCRGPGLPGGGSSTLGCTGAHPAWGAAQGPTLSRCQRCPEERLHSVQHKNGFTYRCIPARSPSS